MHNIEDLMRILGLNENQVRVRLREFRSYIDRHITHGKNNKILVSDSGLKILERVKNLEEEQGLTLDAIKSRLNEELGIQENIDKNGNSYQVQTHTIQSDSLYKERLEDLKLMIETLINQMRQKDEQLKEKDRQIAQLYELIKNRLPPLPPSQEEAQQKLLFKASRWQRFKQFIKGE